MVGRKVFKTRICVLYRKGHCNRHNCSFAHGDADLHRFNNINTSNTSSSSFNGRRDYRGDLREKLGRQRSPPRRNSLDRDARDPLPSHGHSSPRLGKKSDWGQRRRHRFDSENDYGGSLRLLDGVERQARERKPPLSEFKDVNDEQLEQVHSEIDMLEDHKQQLQIYLEESVQEADGLNFKIEEAQRQLSAEKEECERISSKIRKFVKANVRHARIQDELKRSQARLQRLGDHLGSDAGGVNEEDLSIDTSDEETLDPILMSPQKGKASPRKDETLGNPMMEPQKDQYKVSPGKKRTRIRMVEADEPRKDETLGNPIMSRWKDQYKASPSKKRMRAHMVEADRKSKQAASSATGERLSLGHMRSERHYRWEPNVAQTKNTDKVRQEANGINNARPLVNSIKPMRRKTDFTNTPSEDKLKDIKSTRMVANMKDEVVDVVKLNEKPDAREVSPARVEEGSTLDNVVLPPPPPLPVAQDSYLQYKGKDETVDVVTDHGGDTGDDDDDDLNEVDDFNGVDDEMLDVDIV